MGCTTSVNSPPPPLKQSPSKPGLPPVKAPTQGQDVPGKPQPIDTTTVGINSGTGPATPVDASPLAAAAGSGANSRLFTKTDSLRSAKRGVCGMPSDELQQAKLLKYAVENLIGHPKAIKFCAISPDELKMATACTREHAVMLWDLTTFKEMMKLDGHDDGVVCCAFSADARLLATGSMDNSLAVWDTNTGKVLYKLFGHQFLVCTCSFSRDGTMIVSGSGDNSLIIWSVKTGLPLGTLEGHTKVVSCCAFAPEGSHILSASADRTIILWETKSGEKFKQVKAHFDVVLSCSYNSDGSRFISNDKRTLKVWDAATCTQIFAMPIQPSSLSPPTMPDGPVEGAKGAVDRRFVLSMFSPDGRNLIFCSNDRTLTIWDPDLGQEVLCVYTRQNAVALGAGPCNLISFGDEGGNLYLMRLTTLISKKAVIVSSSTPD
eukprot:EG_transcript_6105